MGGNMDNKIEYNVNEDYNKNMEKFVENFRKALDGYFKGKFINIAAIVGAIEFEKKNLMNFSEKLKLVGHMDAAITKTEPKTYSDYIG